MSANDQTTIFQTVQDEAAIAESHLSADPMTAALQLCLRRWHYQAIYQLNWQVLAALYPLMQRFLRLNQTQQQDLAMRFAFIYALPKRTELQLLADAICQAAFWQRHEPLCQWLTAGTSSIRLEAVQAAWLLRQQLPWQLAVPALLNNVCDKIFDVDLSFAFAWVLLEQAEQEPMAYMQQFQPATEMLVEQYHSRLVELTPEITKHLAELTKFQYSIDEACK